MSPCTNLFYRLHFPLSFFFLCGMIGMISKEMITRRQHCLDLPGSSTAGIFQKGILMQQEKLHRKRAYSQKVLKEALLKLLVDQPLSKITVQKLCETADVNRTTFYSNFEDIFALYRQIQDDFLEQMALFTQQQKPYADNRALICDIFRFLYENMDSCRVLILRSEDAFLERLFALQYDVSYTLMKKSCSAFDQDSFDYLYTFRVCGIIGIIRKWINDGLHIPYEQIADYAIQNSDALLYSWKEAHKGND